MNRKIFAAAVLVILFAVNTLSDTHSGVDMKNAKIIDVQYISQNGEYPNGCESVTAVMALNYVGIDIGVDEFIDSYLDMDVKPIVGEVGFDIDTAYGGNPRRNDGWGCNSPVIVNAMNKFVDMEKYEISHANGISLNELCRIYIDNDIPVMIWATSNMIDSSAPKYYVHWKTSDNKDIAYNKKLHCLLLIGYDDDNYYFNDPQRIGINTKYVAYSRSRTNKAYKLMNSQSIAIYHK